MYLAIPGDCGNLSIYLRTSRNDEADTGIPVVTLKYSAEFLDYNVLQVDGDILM